MAATPARLFQSKLRPPIVRGRMLARAHFRGRGARPRAARARERAGGLRQDHRHLPVRAACCARTRSRPRGSRSTPTTTTSRASPSYLRAAIARGVPRPRRTRARGLARGDRGGVIGEAFDLIDSVASSDRPPRDLPRRLREGLGSRSARLHRAPAAHAGTGPAARHRHAARSRELGLARLRANGQLVEIGHGEAALHGRGDPPLRARDPRLRTCRADDVAFLHARTEGWPAALQLAVLALGDSPSGTGRLREFGGSLAEVADYLAAEVLRGCPTTCASSP